MIFKVLGALVAAGIFAAGIHWCLNNIVISKNTKDKE